MRNFIELTDRFPIEISLDSLRNEYDSIKPGDWLRHYDIDHSPDYKVIPLVAENGEMSSSESHRGTDIEKMQRTGIVEQLPYFAEILDAFKCRTGRVRIMRLGPGVSVAPHRDIRHEAAHYAFGLVRLHIPIYTNDKVTFNVAGENVRMDAGRLYYANFIAPHWVANDGDEDRIHLVLDLELNDWLRSVFPQPTAADRVHHLMLRTCLPVWWALLKLKGKALNLAWGIYEDSVAQRLKHKILG